MQTMNRKIIIAIDGYSSSGKSTMAKELASRIGYLYIDSGAMYRAVTLYALRHHMIDDDNNIDSQTLAEALDGIRISFKVDKDSGSTHTFLNGEDVESEIRGMAVSNKVSPISALADVRRKLTSLQQSYGKEKGIVMDGRDIGTTVFPDAEMKVFVNASPEIRAMRRLKELQQKGVEASYEEVLENVNERDRIDRTRKESPLRKAPDALTLDNDNLSRTQQMDWLLENFKRISGE